MKNRGHLLFVVHLAGECLYSVVVVGSSFIGYFKHISKIT